MTLKSWDQLPLQLRRNKRKLYEHLCANTSDVFDDWEDLDGITRRSTIKLWNAIATKINDTTDVPLWKGLTHMQRRSRRLRWTLIYTELQGTTQRTISFTVKDDAAEPAAVSGAKVTVDYKKTGTTGNAGGCNITSVGDGEHTVTVTAEGFEDYSDEITTDSGHTSFNITLVTIVPEEDDDESDGGDE